jgi:geranylgeranyl pyrophosphate synthase
VLDDYLNLQSTEYHQNKSFCEDLTEGKYSFPVVHSIMTVPPRPPPLPSVTCDAVTLPCFLPCTLS